MSLIVVAVASARSRKGFSKYLWDTLAYAARYGMQPLDVLFEMPMSELTIFVKAVSAIVREENAPKQET